MIFQVSYNSSSSISTANHSISYALPFKQHANLVTIYLSMIALSINQHTVQLTIVQRNVNYQTMIFQVSYYSSSIISSANHSISSAFPFVQHANPFTIYLRMIALSINQHTIQLTIVQRNINYQTIIFQVSFKQSSIISTANHSISSAFPFNQHANPPIIHTSAHNFAENESGYNSTNNCSKNYQPPNHHLASFLLINQQYLYYKLLN